MLLLALLACAADKAVPIDDTAPATDSEPVDTVPDDTSPGHSEDTVVDDTSPEHSEDTVVETGPIDTAPIETAETDTGEPPPPCFADIASPVDYVTSGALLNTTCTGTNHQDIAGVERVVFVGDSVTAGAPIPTSDWDITNASEWYRNLLAEEFATRWGLEAPDWWWQNVDLTSGESYNQFSGDFANCSKWGARTDDLHKDNTQLDTCLPEESRSQHNLVVMTVGGNDLYNLLDHLKAGDADEAQMRAEWDMAITDLRDAIHWLRDDPTMFPGGVDIIVADIFDVTDATAAADIADCEGAQLIGLDGPLLDPLTAELAIQWQEALLELAVETDIDVAFMGETFCGHGYNWDDTTGRCYRADPNVYFDISCEHPSAYGHAAIADTMLGVVDE
jgi:hypothetical protein